MKVVRLVVSTGEFVADVEIPPFLERAMPDVVMWGDRVFVRQGAPGKKTDGHWVYSEAFAVVSLTPSPGLPVDVSGPGPKDKPGEALQSKGGAIAPIPAVDRSKRTTLYGMDPDGDEHREIEPSGMQKDYVVLNDDERSKGFVRPVRRTYRHLTCGATTTMGTKLAETYARDPSFYSGTFCVACKDHYPVGAEGEFVWDGTSEKVGT